MENGLTEIINSYYADVLRTANKKRTTDHEAENMYLLAFFGLLRSGCPYTISDMVLTSKQEKDKAIKENKKRDSHSDDLEKSQVIRTINIVLGNVGYSCSTKTLAERFGKQFELIEIDTGSAVSSIKNSSNEYSYTIPYAKFNDDIPSPSKAKEENESSQSEYSKPDPVGKLPFIQDDDNYPKDKTDQKEYDSFLFNSHDIVISFEDGNKIYFTAIVYPIYMDTSDVLAADILVVVIDQDGRMRCGMSAYDSNGPKGVNIEFDDCTLVFRGTWEGNNFISRCGILLSQRGQSNLKENVTNIVPTKKTSSFYMRHKGNDGTYLNVFPLSLLRNNPTSGLAPSIVMIENGISRKIYAGDNNTYLSLWFDGIQRQIEIFWAGTSLNISFVSDAFE